jgi:hypothetical protein
MPARGVPVSSVGRRIDGDDDLVAETGRDLVIAPRASIRLQRLVRLHVTDFERVATGVIAGVHPRSAQSTRTSTTANAIATSARSLVRFARERYGLKPTELP